MLQGGGALGSYQAGVYQALHEAGIEPDWIIGTSIGAINASLIAGNLPQNRLPRLRALTDDEARAVLEDVHAWQRDFLPRLGSRFVFAADELYLQARRPLPPASAYEGFAIAEDGIGLVRRFEDGFPRALRRAPTRLPRARASLSLIQMRRF